MPRMLTVTQLAQRLQVNPETVRRWARNKIIPAIKISAAKKGVWRFPLSEIERWERRNLTGIQNASES